MRRWRSSLRKLIDTGEHRLAGVTGDRDHLVGPGRGATDAEHGVAALQEPARYRVEDLVEDGVADTLAPRLLDQRQRERLPRDGQMAGAEDVERGGVHHRDVGG